MGDNEETSVEVKKDSDVEKRTYYVDKNAIEALDRISSRYYGDRSKGHLLNVALCRFLIRFLDIDRDIELIDQLIKSEQKWIRKLNTARAERIEQRKQEGNSN